MFALRFRSSVGDAVLWPLRHVAEPALPAPAEAMETSDRSGERWYEAELYRLQGELLLARAGEPHPEVEACFRRALEVARQQQATAWELRTAMSWTRLWPSQGKRIEARQLLAESYSWFAEGWDTADLQEARALLAELS